MTRCLPGVALAMLSLVAAPLFAGLPDTGQTLCYDGTIDLVACNSANTGNAAPFPRQDGRFGRDAEVAAGTLAKIGGGAAGFDYTKVANNGTDLNALAVLGSNPTDWACTRDNVTGLTWEVKVNNAAHLRHRLWNYSWRNTDPTTNGGDPGVADGGVCLSAGRCDTQAFVQDVNAAGLCGTNDWRLPTVRELLTLVNFGAASPAIDATYFPNTEATLYSSAITFLYGASDSIIYVDFVGGKSYAIGKLNELAVRLVRGRPF